MHEDAPIVVPIVDRQAIQLERVGGRGMGVYRNETRGVGTATGRDSCE